MFGVFSLLTGLATVGLDARHRPRRVQLRDRGEQPDAQLAARRLLRHPGPTKGVLGPPRRARGRRVPRPAAWRAPRRRGSAGGSRSSCSIVPTMVFVVLALRLREPVRGHFERRAHGRGRGHDRHRGRRAVVRRVVAHVLARRDAAPDLLRAPVPRRRVRRPRIFSSLFYEEELRPQRARAGLSCSPLVAPAQLIGLLLTAPDHHPARHEERHARPPLRRGRRLAVAIALDAVRARAEPRVRGRSSTCIVTGIVVLIVPPIFAALSLAIPPKIRSFGFAVAALWILPGPDRAADRRRARRRVRHPRGPPHDGARSSSSAALVLASAGKEIDEGHQAGLDGGRGAVRGARTSGARAGRSCCSCAASTSHYDDVQVLFGVDLEVDEGEIVALLGTNGAGKSTLLKAICGLVDAERGAIVFDGRDITLHPARRDRGARRRPWCPAARACSRRSPSPRTCSLAGWLHRKDKAARPRGAPTRVLEHLPGPARAARTSRPATSRAASSRCSTLGMAFIAQPRLLMIDELSLGLAPIIVEQLLEIVREHPRPRARRSSSSSSR